MLIYSPVRAALKATSAILQCSFIIFQTDFSFKETPFRICFHVTLFDAWLVFIQAIYRLWMVYLSVKRLCQNLQQDRHSIACSKKLHASCKYHYLVITKKSNNKQLGCVVMTLNLEVFVEGLHSIINSIRWQNMLYFVSEGVTWVTLHTVDMLFNRSPFRPWKVVTNLYQNAHILYTI